MGRRYDLLAIDLDGTLLNSRREVSPRTNEALRRAREAGVRIVICTGRGLAECRHVLEEIDQRDPVAVAGGSIVADPASGRTLHRFNIPHELVARASDRLLEHEHPVMILKDPAATGYDYLMVVGEQRLALDPVTTWWLSSMNVSHRFAARAHEDEHPGHTVRFGVCGLSSRLAQIMADVEGVCGDEVIMHHFGAVVAPEHASRLPDGERLHILEAFSREAGKWSAIRWLAAREGVPISRIAAIGDEINDLSMIEGAGQGGGLGIAMGNAVERVKGAAGRRTRTHDEDGVAHAIEQVLTGAW